MASQIFLTLTIVLMAFLLMNNVHSSDPDILSDFMVPNGAGTTVDPNSFTFTGLRGSLWDAPNNASFKVTKASQAEFPILNGLSVSYALLRFGPGGVNAPHTHPRSAELLIVIRGYLEVGFVDSGNKLFSQVLQTGDMFVFPKGLVHFQRNKDSKYPAVALSAFGSANPGTVSLPLTLFSSGIDADLLAKSFKTDTETIEKLLLSTTQG